MLNILLVTLVLVIFMMVCSCGLMVYGGSSVSNCLMNN